MKTNVVSESTAVADESLLEAQPPPEVGLLNWLLTPVYLLAFISILLVFDLAQRIAIPFGPRALDRIVRLLNLALVQSLHIVGTSVSFEGLRQLPADQEYLIVSNHQSLFDVPILYSCFYPHRPRFVSKKELAKWLPTVSIYLRAGQSAIIDRENRTQAITEIKQLGERMKRHKYAAVIFPEGTRARDGKMKRFRAAGFQVLAKTLEETKIIPVALDGSWKLTTRKFGPIPWGTKVRVVVGQALDRQSLSEDELVDKAYQEIRRLLADIRRETRG